MKMTAQIWAQHIAAAGQEKLSLRGYANQHGLAASTLYYWTRKLRSTANTHIRTNQHSAGTRCSKFVALRVSDATPPSIHALTPPPQTSHCTLILVAGIRLEMTALPDPQWLAALGSAVQGLR